MEQGLSHNGLFSILEDSQGNFWFATLGGVNHYDPDENRITYYTTEEGISHNDVNSLLEDRDGNIWMGIWGHGLNVLSNEG